jgi:hypothetical protein
MLFNINAPSWLEAKHFFLPASQCHAGQCIGIPPRFSKLAKRCPLSKTIADRLAAG